MIALGMLFPEAAAQKKNFKLGPVYFDAAAKFTMEFNDNINNSASNQESDLILSPSVSLESEWNVSEFNTLTFNLGVGYRKYINNSDLDSGSNFLDITPDSRFAFNVFIDTLTLEFFDEFNYSVEATDAFARDSAGNVITNVSQFGRFENRVGVLADWDLNDLKLNAELSRLDIFAQETEFGFTERNTHTLSGGAQFLFAPNFTAGLRGSVSMTDYKEDFQNDGVSYSLGPNFTWEPTSLITVSGSFGYVLSEFDSGGANGDSSDTHNMVGSLRVSHQASKHYSHSIEFSNSTQFGFVSNTTETRRVRYQGDWQAARAVNVYGGVGYEDSDDSGGVSAEEFERIVFDIGTGFTHSEHLSSRIFYEFSTKDSNLSSRSFDRNRIVLSLKYDF